MPTIFDRLRAERERLGLSQQALAERCGVTARSQRNYESGERAPDASYLSAIAAAGADVLYILMGQRSQPLSPEATLPTDEQVLLDSYRRCNALGRQNLIQTAALLSAGLTGSAGGDGKQTNTASGTVQILGSKNRVTNK